MPSRDERSHSHERRTRAVVRRGITIPWLQAVAVSWSLLAGVSYAQMPASTVLTTSTTATTSPETVAGVPTAIMSITSAELRRHVEVLADDTFEGRQQGSRGGRAAGTYLRQHLEKAKLAPAGRSGYFQWVPSGGRNLLAALPGSDPVLRGEHILIGAHYDHVGYGSPTNSYGPTGYIHNGADDNASGVAAILELIDGLGHLESPPKRTLLIAFWDGEENGMLGSKHWIANPTVALDSVQLAFNIDMIGRLENNRLKVFGTRTSTGLRPLVSRANSGKIELDFTWKIEANSDHHSFYSRQIPFLMLHTGLHGNYHRPSDDAHLLNYEGMEKVSRLLLAATLAAANHPKPIAFRAASQSEHPAAKQQLELSAQPSPRLGVRWRRDDAAGLPINHVTYGSAAWQAGLRVGDRIVGMNGKTAGTDRDFIRQVGAAPRNSRLLILRDSTPDAQETSKPPATTEPTSVDVVLQGEPHWWGMRLRRDAGNPSLAVVTYVSPGSPAAKAGVQLRDRIYEVNGVPCGNVIANGSQEVDSNREATIELLVESEGRLQRLRLQP